MATNMFVWFGKDVKGECTEEFHKGWCEVFSLGQSFENKKPPLLEKEKMSDTRRGKHAPVKITKVIDKASLKLMAKCWDGEALPEVKIHCFRAGMGKEKKQPIRYLSIELKSVIIRKFRYRASEGSLLSEELELVAAEADYEYRQMHKELGTSVAPPKLTGKAGIKLRPEDFTDSKAFDYETATPEEIAAYRRRQGRQKTSSTPSGGTEDG